MQLGPNNLIVVVLRVSQVVAVFPLNFEIFFGGPCELQCPRMETTGLNLLKGYFKRKYIVYYTNCFCRPAVPNSQDTMLDQITPILKTYFILPNPKWETFTCFQFLTVLENLEMNIFVTKSTLSGLFPWGKFSEVELLIQRIRYTSSKVFGTYYQVILPDKLDKFLFYSVFFSSSLSIFII